MSSIPTWVFGAVALGLSLVTAVRPFRWMLKHDRLASHVRERVREGKLDTLFKLFRALEKAMVPRVYRAVLEALNTHRLEPDFALDSLPAERALVLLKAGVGAYEVASRRAIRALHTHALIVAAVGLSWILMVILVAWSGWIWMDATTVLLGLALFMLLWETSNLVSIRQGVVLALHDFLPAVLIHETGVGISQTLQEQLEDEALEDLSHARIGRVGLIAHGEVEEVEWEGPPPEGSLLADLAGEVELVPGSLRTSQRSLSWDAQGLRLEQGGEVVELSEGELGALQLSQSRHRPAPSRLQRILGQRPDPVHLLHGVFRRPQASDVRLEAVWEGDRARLTGIPRMQQGGERVELEALLGFVRAARALGAALPR